MLYFDQLTGFERFFDSKWLIYPENHLQKKILQNTSSFYQTLDVNLFLCFHFSKYWFSCGMVKQRNFLHVAVLSFDARFVNYRPFSLHCYEQCPINIIQVKCQQVAQNVSDIFWTCSLQQWWRQNYQNRVERNLFSLHRVLRPTSYLYLTFLSKTGHCLSPRPGLSSRFRIRSWFNFFLFCSH